jgi:LuxR family maltose regulon positive regulatory protein
MARIREAEGDLGAALDFLDDAERLYVGDFFPNVRPVPAMKAQLQARQGDRARALAWVHEQGLSVDDDLSYPREFEHITLARILLAQYTRDPAERVIEQATDLLTRLLAAAEAGGRIGSVIEILILLAVSQQLQGNTSAGLVPLERALTLAEPEGYVRIFVDEGAPMAGLLTATQVDTAATYVRELLTALDKNVPIPSIKQALIEPLSERELEVLRLLSSDLSGPQIARELVVSLNTVRTHTKSIYAKLAVNSRSAAVRRSEELGLLAGRARR